MSQWFTRTFHRELDGIPVTEYRSTRSGLTLTHVSCPGPLVFGQLLLITEEDSNDGLSHTLEHLIFLGSERYPYRGIIDLVANRCLADGTNAWTGKDHTCYTMTTAGAEGFLTLLPVFLDHILFPTLADEAFTTEVHHVTGEGEDGGVVYCEMQARENKQGDRTRHALREHLFSEKCGYSWQSGGMMENLRTTCSNERVRAYHKKFYRPDNLNVIVAGVIDVEAVFGAIEDIDERAAAVDYGPHPTPFSSPPQFFSEPLTRETRFPAKTEENGWLHVVWWGSPIPEVADVMAMSVLHSYLSHSSASPLVKALVDAPEALCARVSATCYSYGDILYCVAACVKKPGTYDEVRETVRRTLGEVHEAPLDMAFLRSLIRNFRADLAKALEENPAEEIADLVICNAIHRGGGGGFEYLEKSTERLAVYERLEREEEGFWKELLGRMIERPSLTLRSLPSAAFMEEVEVTEKERVAARKEQLGEEGLQRAGEELVWATAYNERNAEKMVEVVGSFPVVTPGSPNFHDVSTTTDPDSGITWHRVQSKFAWVSLVYELPEGIPPEEEVLLDLYTTMFLETAVTHDGQMVAYEDAIKLNEEYFMSCSFSLEGGPMHTNLRCGYNFLPEKGARKCLQLIADFARNQHFTADRIATIVKQCVSGYERSLRNASSQISDLSDVMEWRAGVHRHNTYHAQLALLKQFEGGSCEELVPRLEAIQRRLSTSTHISLHFTGSEESLAAIAAAEPTSLFPLRCPPRRTDLSPFLRPSALAGEYVLRVVTTDESSVLHATFDLPLDATHPDIPAIDLFCTYLSQTEGAIYKEIRGKGFAYSTSLNYCTWRRYVMFKAARGSDVARAFLIGRKIVERALEELDPVQISTALGVNSYHCIAMYETPSSTAGTNLSMLHAGLPLDHPTSMMKREHEVTDEQLRRVAREYFLPLFTRPSALRVCCPEGKKGAVLEKLGEAGLEVREVEDVEVYGRELDEKYL